MVLLAEVGSVVGGGGAMLHCLAMVATLASVAALVVRCLGERCQFGHDLLHGYPRRGGRGYRLATWHRCAYASQLLQKYTIA